MITEKAKVIVKVIQSCRSFEQLDNAERMRTTHKNSMPDSHDRTIDGIILLWEIEKKFNELTEKAK